jgi:hypothetical protein
LFPNVGLGGDVEVGTATLVIVTLHNPALGTNLSPAVEVMVVVHGTFGSGVRVVPLVDEAVFLDIEVVGVNITESAAVVDDFVVVILGARSTLGVDNDEAEEKLEDGDEKFRLGLDKVGYVEELDEVVVPTSSVCAQISDI